MAILSNGRHGAGYLAVELTVDKRFESERPFSRGPVTSWNSSPEMDEMWAELAEELDFEPPDWPPMDLSKVGWLNCTIKFIVGATVIYQQGLQVQYTTFWEWFHLLQDLSKTEHEDEQVIWSGAESPELCLKLTRDPLDPDFFGDEPPDVLYGYSLAAYVDVGISAGASGVSGEGPGMFLYPTEANILTFARQLFEEADQAG